MFCINAIRSFSNGKSSFTCFRVFEDLTPYHSVFVSFVSFLLLHNIPFGENSETKVYYGICETFKLRYANHKKSFNHRNRKSDTELSNEIWRIKDNKHSANITWDTLGRHQAYNTISKRCSLCLNEKLKIALHRNDNMLNNRTEILNKCRHKNKFALISYDSKD